MIRGSRPPLTPPFFFGGRAPKTHYKYISPPRRFRKILRKTFKNVWKVVRPRHSWDFACSLPHTSPNPCPPREIFFRKGRFHRQSHRYSMKIHENLLTSMINKWINKWINKRIQGLEWLNPFKNGCFGYFKVRPRKHKNGRIQSPRASQKL